MKHIIVIGIIILSTTVTHAKSDPHSWSQYQLTELIHGATECPMGLSCGRCFRIPSYNKRSNNS